MIAIALAGKPDLLIADEPTTSLDVTIQAQILGLLKSIQQKTGMALWLISHDLALVSTMADRVAVMQQGKIVETAHSAELFSQAKHPYTRKLLNALPSLQSCLQHSAEEKPPPYRADRTLFLPCRGPIADNTAPQEFPAREAGRRANDSSRNKSLCDAPRLRTPNK
jgi:ABC-type dipeptide/oligopeptide/nickel transport system ATPase component